MSCIHLRTMAGRTALRRYHSSNRAADVVVIGAGVLGMSSAYHITRRTGASVLVLESGQIGSGATHKSAGLLVQMSGCDAKVRMAGCTLTDIEHLSESQCNPIGFQRCGTLRVAASDARRAELTKDVARCVEAGVTVEWPVTPERMCEVAPYLDVASLEDGSEAVGAFVESDGWMDPTLMAQAYWRGAADLSSGENQKLMSNCSVERIISTKGNKAVEGVVLEDGTLIRCSAVVDAAGMWAGMLPVTDTEGICHRESGRYLPMAPTRSHYWLSHHDPALYPATMPNVIVPDARFYSRSEAAGSLLLGIQESHSLSANVSTLPRDSVAAHDAASAASADAEFMLAEMSEKICEFVADGMLEELQLQHYVAGWTTYTPDGKYIVGDLQEGGGPPGLFVVSGCNGSGLSSAGGLGRLVAGMVGEVLGAEGAGWEAERKMFSPARFNLDGDFSSEEFRAKCVASRSNKFRQDD